MWLQACCSRRGGMRREDEARASGVVSLSNSQLQKSHRRARRSRGDRHDDAAAVGRLAHGPWNRSLRSKAPRWLLRIATQSDPHATCHFYRVARQCRSPCDTPMPTRSRARTMTGLYQIGYDDGGRVVRARARPTSARKVPQCSCNSSACSLIACAAFPRRCTDAGRTRRAARQAPR